MKNFLILLLSMVLFAQCKKQEQIPVTTEQNNIIQQKEEKNVGFSKDRIVKQDGSPYTLEELNALSHTELIQAVYEPPKDTIKTIGILLYEGYFMLDAMGPLSVLNHIHPAQKLLIGREKGMVTSSDNVKTQVDHSIDDIEQLDILIVPGGVVETYKATQDQELLSWIRKIDQKSTYTASVCTGAWILGAAGVLEGKQATTNWYKAEENLEKYGAEFVQKRYTHDGKYWTSAGVSAGIDMSLALVDHIMGRNYAQFTALNLEYDPDPPFEGGHPDKTDQVVTFMTEKMYDQLLLKVSTDKN